MVISTLKIVPLPKQYSQVLEILVSVFGPAEIQPGCLSCCVDEEKRPDHALVFRAHWETEAALQEHIRSDLYLRVLAACELSNQPPEFCFHRVSKTEGMDLVHKLRGCSGEQPPGGLAGINQITKDTT